MPQPIPDYGDLMTLDDFVECCKCGLFIDYDGHGYYATDKEMSDILATPSDITGGKINSEYTHVVWFNK